MGTVILAQRPASLALQFSGSLALGVRVGERAVNDQRLVELTFERID